MKELLEYLWLIPMQSLLIFVGIISTPIVLFGGYLFVKSRRIYRGLEKDFEKSEQRFAEKRSRFGMRRTNGKIV